MNLLPDITAYHGTFCAQKLVATADANEAYTTFTGSTRLKQGITPQGVFINDNDDKPPPEPVAQLSRSVTVPAPSTSSTPDPPFWHVISRLEIDNVDQINPVPLQRSKTTISVPINRNQVQGSDPSRQPSVKLNRSISSAGRNPGIQQDLATPTRGLSLRVPTKSPPPGLKSAPPSTSSDQSFRCWVTNVISHQGNG